MNSSIETYGKKIRRQVIESADVYVPLGFKLGDFSQHLRINEDLDDQEIDETIRVVEEELFSDAGTRPSSAESLADTVARRVLSEKMNQEVKSSSNSGTIIEMVIPHDNRILDESKVANGLSLFNLAMNSDIVAVSSSHKFMGDAIVKLVDGVGDESLIKRVFHDLGDETKCEIMAEYLLDQSLVMMMRERSSTLVQVSNKKSLDDQIIQIVRLIGTICGILYANLVVPLVFFVWNKVITLNREFRLLETVLRMGIRWLVVILGILLRLVMALTRGKRVAGGDHNAQFDRVAQLVIKLVHGVLDQTQG